MRMSSKRISGTASLVGSLACSVALWGLAACSDPVDDRVSQRWRFEIVAQDTSRRHAAQTQQWRQREAERDRERRDRPDERAAQRRRRQLGLDKIVEQQRETELRQIPDQRADRARDYGEQHELR